MNRLEKLFNKKEKILNIYVTAGFPNLNDTIEIVKELVNNGVDIIEIGMPFSDPLADGQTIQNSNQIAIRNGITLEIIFDQIEEIRKTISIPIVLMGYYNQIIQYGDIAFFNKTKTIGVDGFIIPDLPITIFQEKYKALLKKLELDMIFLITPQTNDERVRLIDNECSGFLYVVSSFAITGSKKDFQQNQLKYFNHINQLNLKNPTQIGFGIYNKRTFDIACSYSEGAIIGSAFIKALEDGNTIKTTVSKFIKTIR